MNSSNTTIIDAQKHQMLIDLYSLNILTKEYAPHEAHLNGKAVGQ